MLCATHELIAEKVFEIVKSKFNVPLDLESLLEGSTAPDKKPAMIIIPHTKNQSFDLLNQNFEWLKSKTFSLNNDDNKLLSYKLGVIIHLISDYFCTAHNNIKFLNPITHLLYENRLKHFFAKSITAFKFDLVKNLADVNGNLHEFINKKHSEYLNNKSNMLNDFIYCVTTVSTVLYYLVSELLNVDKSKLIEDIGSFMIA